MQGEEAQPPVGDTRSEITRLLEEWSGGDPEALAKLMPLVVDDVRDIAGRFFARESAGHTLQPTALVNEVYLRLVGRRSVRWQNRAQFFGHLGEMMRRILVDHAKKHLAAKRKGQKISLDETIQLTEVRHEELIAVDDALEGLAAVDPRKCRIVELRFFTGLTETEIAEVLGISLRTVSREWQKAKMWLRHEIRRSEETG